MSEGQRTIALIALLRLEQPLAGVLRDLNRISGESEADLVVLQSSHIRSVLERFILGRLTSLDVENWASAIEMSEGIGTAAEDLRSIIFELANPQICAEITPDLAENLLARLDGDPKNLISD